MVDPVKFRQVEFASARATQATEWVFAEFFDERGLSSIAEITAGANTSKVIDTIPELLAKLESIGIESGVQNSLGFSTAQLQSNRVLATAVSAIRTAVSCIQAEYAGVSLTEALGGTNMDSVQLYANINRSLLNKDRSPEAFASMAERAVRAGFKIVKCAPFDEVRPPSTAAEILDIACPGIDRVAAVRAAVGPNVQVLVDCHSRFERHTAPLIEEELARLNIGWFEEPVAPTTDQNDLAEIAREISTPVAGGENGYGERFFVDLVERGSVKTIMPDIKYCGGAAEAIRAGNAVLGIRGKASLHSPSGPISLLASAHATAAMPDASPLEHAVYEVDWRAELIIPAERVEGGQIWFPRSNGLGAKLNAKMIERHGRRWKP